MKNEITFDAMMANLKSQNSEAKEFFEISESVAEIIEALVDARISKGWSQRKLAELCGIKQSAIARMERFQVMPRLDTIIKIARKLDIQILTKSVVFEEVASKNISVTIDFDEYANHSKMQMKYSNKGKWQYWTAALGTGGI